MHKLILVLLMVTASWSAMAEWLKVDSDKIGTYYADPSSMQEIENKILMTDLAEMLPNGKPFSVKTQREYDCQKQQVRIMSMAAYHGIMGEGEEIFNHQNHEEWQTIMKSSPLESLFRLACHKKK